MSQIDSEILKEFVDESKGIVGNALELLEGIDGNYARVQDLKKYGGEVDRIMGGAKNLALMVDKTHPLHLVGDYAALCKAVGYKASQIRNNEQFFNVCVALLLDATETLDILISNLNKSLAELKKNISGNFLERLRWVSSQFSDAYSGTVQSQGEVMNQDDIDNLLKKLGM